MLTIKDVEYVKDYTLLCVFSDGVRKTVDLTPLLEYPAFAELKDPKLFIQFGLDNTIFWKNGADIAPEYLYEHGVISWLFFIYLPTLFTKRFADESIMY